MPKLPVAKPNEIYTLAKHGDLDVVVELNKPVFGTKGKSNFKRTAFIVIGLVVLASGFVIFYDFAAKPKPTDKAVKQQTMEFEYPLNIADIKFPSDIEKLKFMDNFNKAKEVSGEERYKLLETNYLVLKGYYISTHGSEFRLQLVEYKKYMDKKYQDQVVQNRNTYAVKCFDPLCGTIAYATEILELKDDIKNNSSIDKYVVDFLMTTLESAAISKEREAQKGYYITALSSLYSEYQKSKDTKTLSSYKTLAGFINTNYGQGAIPDSIKI